MTTQGCYCGDTFDTIVTPSRKNLLILKEYENKVICFCFASFSAKYFIYGQMEHQFWIYGSKSYCKLSFSGILPPTVPFWNQHKLLMCYYNLNIYVGFYIFLCRTMNNLNKLLIIVVPYTKQMNWLYKHYHFKTSPCFYRKLYHIFYKIQ